MQAFQTSEELEAEDSWFCSKCKRHVQANKKLDLWTTPEVLVVHLKRFFFTRLRRDKLDVKVEFPLENWDLSEYLPQQQVQLWSMQRTHATVCCIYETNACQNDSPCMSQGLTRMVHAVVKFVDNPCAPSPAQGVARKTPLQDYIVPASVLPGT